MSGEGRVSLSKRDTETVRRWAKRHRLSPTQVVKWIIQFERERAKTGCHLDDRIAMHRDRAAERRPRRGHEES